MPATGRLATVHVADLDLAPNEASGLLGVQRPELLREHGWDLAFWSVLDEVDVGECLVLLGHRFGQELRSGWDAVRVPTARTGDAGRADDAESIAHHDGWVYAFGSQHGGKDGPIRRREQWVARFREADVGAARSPVELAVVRTPFLLHRLVNDALRTSDVDVLPMGDATRRAFIGQILPELAGTSDAAMVRADDWTINVEGAEFLDDGTLLLGLRYPVAADGRPLLVGLRGCGRLFDGGTPEVIGIWPVDAVGRGGIIAGIRDLCVVGSTLHVVTGNLDSKGKGSVLLADHPEGLNTVNTHFEVDLGGGRNRLTGRAVREFPEHPRIEGLAADDGGRFFYVSDENATVHLRCTPLMTEG